MPVLGFKTPGDFARFRSLLTDAGFTDRGILEALGVDDILSVHADDEALVMWRTRRGTVLDILIRLFLMNLPVDVDVARRAVLPMTARRPDGSRVAPGEWLDGDRQR